MLTYKMEKIKSKKLIIHHNKRNFKIYMRKMYETRFIVCEYRIGADTFRTM